jgi:hypothetical protein
MKTDRFGLPITSCKVPMPKCKTPKKEGNVFVKGNIVGNVIKQHVNKKGQIVIDEIKFSGMIVELDKPLKDTGYLSKRIKKLVNDMKPIEVSPIIDIPPRPEFGQRIDRSLRRTK